MLRKEHLCMLEERAECSDTGARTESDGLCGCIKYSDPPK